MKVLTALYHSYVNEFRSIWHEQGVILFFLFLPLAYPVIYSLIYNPELVRDVPVVVVDHDRTALSRDLVRRFNAAQAPRVIGYAADLPEARDAMNRRACFAILEIPEGFARTVGRGEKAIVPMYCEMSLLLRYRALLFASNPVTLAMNADIQAQSIDALGVESLAPGSGDPMRITGVNLGDLNCGFDSFIMPGVLILILQQCIILAVGMTGGARREMARAGIDPVTPQTRSTLGVITGRTLCYITIMVFPILWLVHFVPIVFQFPMAGDTMQIFAFLLPMVIASIAAGFMVQPFCHERESVIIIWVATSLLFLFLSGLTWPVYAQSAFWRTVGSLIPATWGMQGFIIMNANGASLSDVAPLWEHLWILAAVYSFLAWAIHSFYLRPRLSRLAHAATTERSSGRCGA